MWTYSPFSIPPWERAPAGRTPGRGASWDSAVVGSKRTTEGLGSGPAGTRSLPGTMFRHRDETGIRRGFLLVASAQSGRPVRLRKLLGMNMADAR